MTETKQRTGRFLHRSGDERQGRFIPQKYGGNYLALVVGLILTFIFVALLASEATNSLASRFTVFLFYATVFIGFRGTTRKTQRNATFGVVIALAYAIDIATTLVEYERLDQISSLIRMILVLVLMVLVLRDIVGDDRVTIDTILGSVGAYLLFAMAWASVYVAFERGDPDAFNIPDSSGSSFADLLYFSVVTQTTLGYGDIVPVEPVVRQLASLQALLSQLYVAILVAWLVGIAASQYLGSDRHELDD